MTLSKSTDSSIKKELLRDIAGITQRELWARAAGRCQFNGCNRILYKSPITQESVNISNKAHIYSFSPEGPRGQGIHKNDTSKINDCSNLLLVCHDCHKTIDKENDGGRYTSNLLLKWKKAHEKRIYITTGINPKKTSHVMIYHANIGEDNFRIDAEEATASLFPEYHPAEEHPSELSMSWLGKDDSSSYWEVEASNLRESFKSLIIPQIKRNSSGHFSVFGFAPMPLLTLLGSLLTDKVSTNIHQRRREPVPSWKWLKTSPKISFKIKRPKTNEHPPALALSLSANINHSDVHKVIGSNCSLWELTIDQPNNDFLKTARHLSDFRSAIRSAIAEISTTHSKPNRIMLFPAVPVACAIEIGRARMPKADPIFEIYDYNRKTGGFVKALEIGE